MRTRRDQGRNRTAGNIEIPTITAASSREYPRRLSATRTIRWPSATACCSIKHAVPVDFEGQSPVCRARRGYRGRVPAEPEQARARLSARSRLGPTARGGLHGQFAPLNRHPGNGSMSKKSAVPVQSVSTAPIDPCSTCSGTRVCRTAAGTDRCRRSRRRRCNSRIRSPHRPASRTDPACRSRCRRRGSCQAVPLAPPVAQSAASTRQNVRSSTR